ncbi:unnamed protein product [Chironomus riparius]|uniref:C3H1-type domain-containing protein n=1 Tax=Chironomus riparius TaxID=315576 RepID=A0A9N9S586_9DIPT|nr:unnamed protein product [Chironomus riparius]
MESDDDSRTSNSSGSSNSSSNGPASPAPQNDNENESNDQPERSNSVSQDSNSIQDIQDNSNQGHKSPSPVHDKSNEQEQSKSGQDDEEELELSDIDDDESNKNNKKDISHEDLSDISDLESSNGPPSPEYTDLRQKLQNKRQNGSTNELDMKNDEDELDFEDDEVKESSESVKKQPQMQQQQQQLPPQESKDSGNGSVKEDGEHKSDIELESGEELEDGEVTDGDEKRPEESEPKAVCRFFTRGQCTWGMSCRFLHPGTTDKGNYTMFDLVRPIPVPQGNMGMMPSYDYRTERPPIHHAPHIPPNYGGPARPPLPANDNESAWERGLRTAKEMMRKANKRKEQDMDFDEKKMNLSGPPDEVERDPYYVRGSPEDAPAFEKLPRGPPPMRGGPPFSPPAKFARNAAFYEADQYGRMPRSYRELPPHRMPHYEDEEIGKRRPNRPTREVIVEKASDDWNDPWMRKKSPGRGGSSKGRKGRERSYSSNSSYSSSSSSSRSRSRSHSSSDSSPNPNNRRRFDSKNSREHITPRKVDRKSRSTSLKRRHSPVRPRITKKAISPVVVPKRAKKQVSPSAIKAVSGQRKKRDSSSSSGGSESDSSYSSSTSSSKGKKRREKLASERKPAAAKKVEMTKKRAISPVQQPAAKEDDKPVEKPSEKASAAAKLKSSRREELLKQLKAVEDAIARKRSKIT